MRTFSAGLILLAVCSAIHAATPVLEHFHPCGAQRGQTITVNAAGKFDPWPVKAWADHPGLTFTASSDSGVFSVEVADNVPPGPHLVRLYNSEGASALRVFMVGTYSETLEADPNDEAAKAQPLDALPITINGQLEKSGDTDAYAFDLQAGQCLIASVQGRRLGAPMDPLLHLLDASGNTLAFSHDGRGLDPILVYYAKRPGTFIIRILAFAHPPAADVKLAGGKSNIYRLSLTTGPHVRYALPSAIGPDTRAIRLFGWNLPASGQLSEFNPEPMRKRQTKTLNLPTSDSEGRLQIDFTDSIEQVESAVVDFTKPVSIPFAMTGCLSRAGDEDRAIFTARKGEKFSLSLISIAAASSLDPIIRIEDSAGKQVARDDDAAGDGNAKLEWTAPEDGAYRIIASDLNGHGGNDFIYRLTIRPTLPQVSAAVAAHEYRLEPGKSVAIKLNLTRQNGHTTPLLAIAASLPPGVISSRTPLPAASGEMTITLTAASNAAPASAPFRILLLDADEMPLSPAASYDLTKDANQELIDKTDSTWLTVLPRPPATQPADKSK